jgi:hypothetical protein
MKSMPSSSDAKIACNTSKSSETADLLAIKKSQNAMPQGSVADKRDRTRRRERRNSKQRFSTMHVNRQEKKKTCDFFRHSIVASIIADGDRQRVETGSASSNKTSANAVTKLERVKNRNKKYELQKGQKTKQPRRSLRRFPLN